MATNLLSKSVDEAKNSDII
ncbi:hypothetical protein [Paenibacillus sp. NPDC093718]